MKPTRRQFFTQWAQAAASGAVAGTIWYQLVTASAQADPAMVRPPGAREGKDFLARCIKCGSCVTDCPFQALRLARWGRENTPGTPFFVPREEPCHMCSDLPCVRACPTGALDPALRDINDADMGVARIDQQSCLAYLGLRCEVCYRVCPRIDTAVTLRYESQERSGNYAFVLPVVHDEECTGCGMCEHACPTDVAAIRVLPRRLVTGRVGKHYRLGRGDAGQISRDFRPATPHPDGSGGGEKRALEQLNKGAELYDDER
ncbi:MAG: ferredoxin-type protein NapG [Candidatus Schekmanbacteria bacterium]|nr:ferredoxin-type protein NapG [Candidatus Schekmanbacteria bacterium]